jgi:hypothetical protein
MTEDIKETKNSRPADAASQSFGTDCILTHGLDADCGLKCFGGIYYRNDKVCHGTITVVRSAGHLWTVTFRTGRLVSVVAV